MAALGNDFGVVFRPVKVPESDNRRFLGSAIPGVPGVLSKTAEIVALR